MTYRPEDIEIVRTDEIGARIDGAYRHTVNEDSGNVQMTGVYHRRTYDTGYHPPARCKHVFKDGSKCTFAADRCPGHKDKSWAEFIGG